MQGSVYFCGKRRNHGDHTIWTIKSGIYPGVPQKEIGAYGGVLTIAPVALRQINNETKGPQKGRTGHNVEHISMVDGRINFKTLLMLQSLQHTHRRTMDVTG